MTIRFEHRGESAFAGALAPMDKVTGLKTGHYGRKAGSTPTGSGQVVSCPYGQLTKRRNSVDVAWDGPVSRDWGAAYQI